MPKEKKDHTPRQSPDIKKMAEAANIFTEAITGAATALHRQAPGNLGNQPQAGGMNMDTMSRFKITNEQNTSQPQGGVPKQ